jgi:type IV pilus assembly protein PilV
MQRTTIKQRGVFILESLIAVLIFSVGILGIVGLLAVSVTNAAGAKYRNDASLLANSIVGQMWVDDKTNASLKTNFESPNGTKFVTWKSDVTNAMPGSAANPPTITINTSNVATITVRWQAPGEPAAHNYILSALINN